MKKKLRMRNAASSGIAQFLPTLHTQLQFNALSQADLDNHLRFIDSTGRFHERLRLHFYPKIFEGSEAKNEAWSQFKPVYFREAVKIEGWKTFLPLVLITGILAMLCGLNFRRNAIW
jgi:ABC-2 type transport system permease protein